MNCGQLNLSELEMARMCLIRDREEVTNPILIASFNRAIKKVNKAIVAKHCENHEVCAA